MTGIEFRAFRQVQPMHFQHIPVHPGAVVKVQPGVHVERAFHPITVQNIQQFFILYIAVVIAECQGFLILLFPVHLRSPFRQHKLLLPL